MTTTLREPAAESAATLATYEAARRRGVEFILRQIAPDGRVGPAWPRVTYYRVPWALAVAGEAAAASRVLAWIAREGLSPAGELHGGVAGASDTSPMLNTYAETCLAYGATLMRRFDLAARAMRFASAYQDPVTGGVWGDRAQANATGPQLLFPTAQFGMSALITGHLDAALAAGEWLARLWAAQPELPAALYTVWTGRDGLVVTPPAGANPLQYRQESQTERSLHYNGGIAAAFLTQLFLRTDERRWLELAIAFQDFSLQSTPDQFNTKQVCKSAWGAGLLWSATGDDRYRGWVRRMGDWFVAGQEPDGHWNNTAYLDPESPVAHQIEITAEFVVHLDTVIAALATR